ncbi:MAG: glycosyltransferase family 4 protein [Chloroflexota bacterium]
MTVLAPIGGIEAALVPLVRELQAQGHRVIVYTIEAIIYPNQNEADLREAGIQIMSAPSWLVKFVAFIKPYWPSFLNGASWLATVPFLFIVLLDALWRKRPFLRSLRGAKGKIQTQLGKCLKLESLYYLHLRQLFRQHPPDVAHVHGWGCGHDPVGAITWLRQNQIPVTYTEHNSPDPKRSDPILAAPMNQANVLIAVSQAGKTGLEIVGQAKPPIVVIPYSVEPLPPPTNEVSSTNLLTITSIARLAPQKGHTHLLEALTQVTKTLPQTSVLIAGAGPLRQKLEKQTTQSELQNHVRFLGSVTRTELPNLLNETDIFVLPSYWEGLPVSLIEAMSASKAFVVTDVGGNPELIHDGQNGFVVPPANAQALAQALITLGQDKTLREKMGQASYARFSSGTFSPTTVTKQTIAAYRMAIAQN